MRCHVWTHLPGHHPSTPIGVKQSADRNASKLGDGAHVPCCGNRSGSQVELRRHNRTSRFQSHAPAVRHVTLQLLCLIPSSLVSSYSTCSLFQLQISHPGVDQDPLSGTRGASQHDLCLQGGVLRDRQRVEVRVQWLLATCAVLVVNPIRNPLEDRRALQSFVLYMTSPNVNIIAMLPLPL